MERSDDRPEIGPGELESRPPDQNDLVTVCRELNRLGVRYMVVGGFAIMAAGYPRTTGDLDLFVDESPENEARLFEALKILPDQAVRELQPGELGRYPVIRVADEIVVDVMSRVAGLSFEEAERETVQRQLGDVSIPFASPRLLWRMKSVTHREKDKADLMFLRQWFAERGETPPGGERC